MLVPEFGCEADIQRSMPVSEGVALDSFVVIRELQSVNPLIHADRGGRLDMWHPMIGTLQGLFCGHRHICSMDRGMMPMWPEWATTEDIVEVPLDYALLHDDFPVCDMVGGAQEVREDQKAWVIRPTLDYVTKVGWAEVFYRLLNAHVDGVSRSWLTRTFGVSMDWMSKLKTSPVKHTFDLAAERGCVEM